MRMYLYVAVASALGGTARYFLAGWMANQVGEVFPWGTIVINITGSFAIAFFAALTGSAGRFLVATEWRTFFMVGICGGYTTFSSFSLQTLNLARDGEWLLASANVAVSVVMCLLGAALGFVCASALGSA